MTISNSDVFKKAKVANKKQHNVTLAALKESIIQKQMCNTLDHQKLEKVYNTINKVAGCEYYPIFKTDTILSEDYREGESWVEAACLASTRKAITDIYEALAVLADEVEVSLERTVVNKATGREVIAPIITKFHYNTYSLPNWDGHYTEREKKLREEIAIGAQALADALDPLIKLTEYDPYTVGEVDHDSEE